GRAERIGAAVIHDENGNAVPKFVSQNLLGHSTPGVLCILRAQSNGKPGDACGFQPKGRDRALARSGMSVNSMAMPSGVWRTTRPFMRPTETLLPRGGRTSVATLAPPSDISTIRQGVVRPSGRVRTEPSSSPASPGA